MQDPRGTLRNLHWSYSLCGLGPGWDCSQGGRTDDRYGNLLDMGSLYSAVCEYLLKNSNERVTAVMSRDHQ